MSTELFLTKLGAWTLDDLAQLPDDGRRYEIIDGSLLILVSPPPSNYHQGLAFDSVARLVSHRHPLGLATVKPAAGQVLLGPLADRMPRRRLLVGSRCYAGHAHRSCRHGRAMRSASLTARIVVADSAPRATVSSSR